MVLFTQQFGIFGAFTVIKGGMTVGQLTSFLTMQISIPSLLIEISGVITELENALACAKRLFDFIDTPAQEPDAPDAWELEKADGRVSVDSCFPFLTEKKFRFLLIFPLT